MAERWKLWWTCMDCQQVLERHDPEYDAKHDQECPAAAAIWPEDMPDWRHHLWGQQTLEPHECDHPEESLVSALAGAPA